MDLSGQAAVVTGAGSGLGRATAEVLASAGASIVVADIDRASASATEQDITAAGGRAVSEVVDVARRDQVEGLADVAVEAFGRIDTWANVAGIMRDQRATDVTEADLDAVLAVNLKGVVSGCQAATRVMMGQGSGSIVNVVSAIVDVAVPGMVGYAVSKAAAAMYTKVLAREVAWAKIRVNAVAPGWTLTGMTGRGLDADDLADISAKQGNMVPLGRVAEPTDVADTIVYLASDLSVFTTGQILRPHGGVTMPW